MRMSFVFMMSQNPYKIRNKKELFKMVYQMTSIANKRIEQVERAGYKIIQNPQKFYINPKTGRFDVNSKNDSVEKLQRKYAQLKAFMNSPGNDVKKIKKQKKRLMTKYKNEGVTEADYAMYREYAGEIWAKMDEEEKRNGIGSIRMESIIIRTMKQYSTFTARLNHIKSEIEAEKQNDLLKQSIFEKQMAESNKAY